MKSKTLLISLFLTFTFHVNSQTAAIPTVQGMTNDQLWEALLSPDLQGNTIFNKCRLTDNTACANCFCDYYFYANVAGSYNMKGWPKNPASGDSTGCNNGTRWGGYSAAMATPDLKANARAMLLDALNANACGTFTPPVTSSSIDMQDSAKFKFADPSFNGGKIKCGTTHLGPQNPNLIQFTFLPDGFCLSAYYSALKGAAKIGTTVPLLSQAQWLAYGTGNSAVNTLVYDARIANQEIPMLMNSAPTTTISGVTIYSPQELIDARVGVTGRMDYTLDEKRALYDAILTAGKTVYPTSKLQALPANEDTLAERSALYPAETARRTSYQTFKQNEIISREFSSLTEARSALPSGQLPMQPLQ